jgi:hypothetical protein
MNEEDFSEILKAALIESGRTIFGRAVLVSAMIIILGALMYSISGGDYKVIAFAMFVAFLAVFVACMTWIFTSHRNAPMIMNYPAGIRTRFRFVGFAITLFVMIAAFTGGYLGIAAIVKFQSQLDLYQLIFQSD